MGGDDSQKLLPWRGIHFSSGAQPTSGYRKINTLTQTPEGSRPFFFGPTVLGPAYFPKK